MLIEQAVDVASQDRDGNTPLHLASFYGQVEVACMLIEYGADVAARNKDGQTPLHLATPTYWIKKSRKCAEVARILLDNGADLNAQNKYGLTPLSYGIARWVCKSYTSPSLT